MCDKDVILKPTVGTGNIHPARTDIVHHYVIRGII